MKKLHLAIVMTLFVGFVCKSVYAQNSNETKDEVAVRAVIKNYENSWNKHDAISLANLYHVDASKVNWYGTYYKGKDSIQALYKTIHNSYYKSSHFKTLSIEDLTFVKPDVVIIHCLDELTGDERNPKQIFHHRRTIVLTKREDVWKILAVQNAKLPN